MREASGGMPVSREQQRGHPGQAGRCSLWGQPDSACLCTGYTPPPQPHRDPGYAGEQGEARRDHSCKWQGHKGAESYGFSSGCGEERRGDQSGLCVGVLGPQGANCLETSLALPDTCHVTHGQQEGGTVPSPPAPASSRGGSEETSPGSPAALPRPWPAARPVPVCPPDLGDVPTSPSLGLSTGAMAVTFAAWEGQGEGPSSTHASPLPKPLTPCRPKDTQFLP